MLEETGESSRVGTFVKRELGSGVGVPLGGGGSFSVSSPLQPITDKEIVSRQAINLNLVFVLFIGRDLGPAPTILWQDWVLCFLDSFKVEIIT